MKLTLTTHAGGQSVSKPFPCRVIRVGINYSSQINRTQAGEIEKAFETLFTFVPSHVNHEQSANFFHHRQLRTHPPRQTVDAGWKAFRFYSFTIASNRVLERQSSSQMVIDACAELNLVALRKQQFSSKISECEIVNCHLFTRQNNSQTLYCDDCCQISTQNCFWPLKKWSESLFLSAPVYAILDFLSRRGTQGKNGWHKKIAQKLTFDPGIWIFETRLSNSDLSFIKLSILR